MSLASYDELSRRHADICAAILSAQEGPLGPIPVLIPDLFGYLDPPPVDASALFCVLQDMIVDELVVREPHGYMLTVAGVKMSGQEPAPTIDDQAPLPGARLRNSSLAH